MSIELDSGTRLAELLHTHQAEIVTRWKEAVLRSVQGRAAAGEVEAELRELFRALLRGVGDGTDDIHGAAYDELRALLSELSRARARQGFRPSETAGSVFALKDPVLDVLEEEPGAHLAGSRRLSKLIDELGLFTIEVFVQTREDVIVAQSEQLLELSTPVVKLWEGVVAVPLVGTLDSARTQVVMEKLLQTLVDTGSAHAIIDITGVPAVDTQVAQHLLKTVVAARLMGAECLISGIRPQIAQTIVALGIEFGDIPTKATLADALTTVLRQSGVDVVRRPRREG